MTWVTPTPSPPLPRQHRGLVDKYSKFTGNCRISAAIGLQTDRETAVSATPDPLKPSRPPHSHQNTATPLGLCMVSVCAQLGAGYHSVAADHVSTPSRCRQSVAGVWLVQTSWRHRRRLTSSTQLWRHPPLILQTLQKTQHTSKLYSANVGSH